MTKVTSVTSREELSGYRALVFSFAMKNGSTKNITFDLLRYPDANYAELEGIALRAMAKADLLNLVENYTHTLVS